MKYCLYIRIFLLCLIAVNANIATGQQTGFFLRTDRSDIHDGETFVLEAALENMEGEDIKMPDLSPFEVLQGPSTARSMSVINGKRSFSQSYKFLLKASKKGTFEIGPATCRMGGKLLKTNVLKITVLGRKDTNVPADPGDKPTFIRMEVSENPAYPGQQLVLDYIIYTRQNLESCTIDNQPKNPGFFSQDVEDIRDQPQRIRIKGTEYYTQVVRRVLLFPQKTGEFDIEPSVFSITVPMEEDNSGFFFRNVKREKITTNPLKIKVNKLPDGAPSSFNGSVGQFAFKAEVKKPTVAKGEAIKLQVEIQGNGDPNLLKAPEVKIPEGFEKYEPSLVYENSYMEGKKLTSVAQYEYLFVAQAEGTYNIVPEFSFFSPSEGKYITRTADTVRVSVLPSSATTTQAGPADTGPSVLPLSDDSTLTDMKSGFLGSLLFWSLLGLIAAGTAAGLYLRIRRSGLSEIANMADHKTKSLARLSEARDFFARGDLPSYYERLNETTTGYLLNKYDIPHQDSGLEGITSHLSRHGAGPEAIDLFREIRQKCELARFAGTLQPDATLYDKAVRLIGLLDP